jgi:hypothetical protein
MDFEDDDPEFELEWARYAAALPTLMKTELAGRWVVFKDGLVQSAHDCEDEALDEAARRFTVYACYVVTRVGPMRRFHVGDVARQA